MEVRIHLIQMRKSTDHQIEKRPYRETCRSLLDDTHRDHPRESHRCLYRETCRGNVDYRITGIPRSTVQQMDTNRKETVKRLIQQFENHPNMDLLLQDFNKTESSTRLLRRNNARLRLILGSWHRFLHMWQMPAAYRKESTDEQRQIRRAVNSWLCHQKKKLPMVTWTIYAADHVLQST